MITFTCKYGMVEITVKTEHEQIDDVINDFRCFLLAVGYHPDTVQDTLNREEVKGSIGRECEV